MGKKLTKNNNLLTKMMRINILNYKRCLLTKQNSGKSLFSDILFENLLN